VLVAMLGAGLDPSFGICTGAGFCVGGRVRTGALGAFVVGRARIGPVPFVETVGGTVVETTGGGFVLAFARVTLGSGFAIGALAMFGTLVTRGRLGRLGSAFIAGAGAGTVAAAVFAIGRSGVMRGRSSERVPLAVRRGSAGICFQRGSLAAALAALAAGASAAAASILVTRAVDSESRSTSCIGAHRSDPVDQVKLKNSSPPIHVGSRTEFT
jgi:hypothetical protein